MVYLSVTIKPGETTPDHYTALAAPSTMAPREVVEVAVVASDASGAPVLDLGAGVDEFLRRHRCVPVRQKHPEH